MNINDIMTAISTVGFPIAMVVWMELKNQKNEEINRQERKELNEVINNFSLNIQENTNILRQLTEIIKEQK